MNNPPILVESVLSQASKEKSLSYGRSLFELSKPRIIGLVLVSTYMGYLLAGGNQGGLYVTLLLVATFLVGAGANTLNQYLEIDSDRRMPRTRNRPLPSGRVGAGVALWGGIASGLLGVVMLYLFINPISAALGLTVLVTYVLMYTPLKKVTTLNTTVGAIPGSIPAMLGWTAASNTFGHEPGILFLIMFVWQHPHTLSIAWMYREDYKLGGLRMITVDDQNGGRTRRQLILWGPLMILVSLLPSRIGMAGDLYFYGALLLGLWFYAVSLGMAANPNNVWAKRLLKTSVFYLPLLFVLMFVDATP